MTRPDARVTGHIEFGSVETVAYMKERDGKIICLARHGSWVVPIPVLEDGSLADGSDLSHLCAPQTLVQLVDPYELGILPDLRRAGPLGRQTG